jgi:hypothetical protein
VGAVLAPVHADHWWALARQEAAAPRREDVEWHDAQADNAIQEADGLGAAWHLIHLLKLRPLHEWALRRLAFVQTRAGRQNEAIGSVKVLPTERQPEALEWLLADLLPDDPKSARWCAGVIGELRPTEARWPEEQAAVAKLDGDRKAREAALNEALRRGADQELLVEVALERAEDGRVHEGAMLLAQADLMRPLRPREAIRHALLRLGLRDMRAYGLICRRLLRSVEEKRRSLPTTLLSDAVWVACLSPEGLGDTKLAETLMKEVADRKDIQQVRLHTVEGALAFRKNEPRNALLHFRDVVRALGGPTNAPVAALSAMAFHQEKRKDAAQRYLKISRLLSEDLLRMPIWMRVQQEALMREAVMVCGTEAPPGPPG